MLSLKTELAYLVHGTSPRSTKEGGSVHTVHHLTSHLGSEFRYIRYTPPFFSSVKEETLSYLPHKVVGRSDGQTDIECFADSWACTKLTVNVSCNYYYHFLLIAEVFVAIPS